MGTKPPRDPIPVAPPDPSGAMGRSALVDILDQVAAIIYVADVETYELLFVNAYTREAFGDVLGQCCWKALQADKRGPCDFCTNDELMNSDGTPGEVYAWELRNTRNHRWYDIRDRIIRWHDGRLVRLEVAVDITDRKDAEQKARDLREQLLDATRTIRTLEGALPMCAWCKRVRDREGEWHTIESLLSSTSDRQVTHGMCPRCAREVE